jgi:hypothetical protein
MTENLTKVLYPWQSGTITAKAVGPRGERRGQGLSEARRKPIIRTGNLTRLLNSGIETAARSALET